MVAQAHRQLRPRAHALDSEGPDASQTLGVNLILVVAVAAFCVFPLCRKHPHLNQLTLASCPEMAPQRGTYLPAQGLCMGCPLAWNTLPTCPQGSLP